MDEDTRLSNEREKHQQYIVEENINKMGKFNSLRWEVYTKKKEEVHKLGVFGIGFAY